MTSHRLLLALTVLAACAEDEAVVLYGSGVAMEPVQLAPSDPYPVRQASYRWLLVEGPEASQATDPVGGETATFRPDRRGMYLVERWLAYGLTEDLTHRFVIDVAGAVPLARPALATSTTVGTAIVATDQSESAEDLPLTARWRLVSRPGGSSAALSVEASSTTSFVPDVPGNYTLELLVFDGELWSAPALVSTRAAQ